MARISEAGTGSNQVIARLHLAGDTYEIEAVRDTPIWVNGVLERAKRLRHGKEVPREMWAKTDPIEVGIPQERTPSGSFPVEEIEQELAEQQEKKPPRRSLLAMLGLRDKTTGRFQWAVLILYVLIATGLALAIHAMLTMTRV